MHYVDQSGHAVSLGNKLGTGGEGTVYEIVSKPDQVAKLYHQPASPEKAAKLAAMTGLATPTMLKFAAWPKGTLHRARGGATVGIVLPRVQDAREIHELYSPAHRKLHFPRSDWRFLIRTARNCAAAFATLHDHRIVIGDVNQGNIFVSSQAIANLIDCDSFQFQANGTLYRCPVGVAHFVPPELQNTKLSEVVRTTNHDNFGLAVLIFHLLFMGRHPFAGRFSGPGDMPIERAIREYRFAYSSSAARLQMAPPPNTPTLAILPQECSLLFERAFSRGSAAENVRPSSLEWARMLERLEGHVRVCADDPGHTFFSQLRDCPWCSVIRGGGPNFFISVSIQAVVARSASFNLAQLWAEIKAAPRPDQVYTPAPRPWAGRIVPRPLANASDDTRLVRHFTGMLAGGSAIATVFAVLFPPVLFLSAPLCVGAFIAWMLLQMSSPIGKIKRERWTAHRNRAHELERARIHQRDVANRYLNSFQSKFRDLERLKNSYERLGAERSAELNMLRQQVHERQMEQYLRQFFISSASIPGIGPGRIAALESYGIETAHDIVPHAVLNVPGFGERMTERLLAWRQILEHSFQFDPSKGVPQADIQTVEMKYAQKRSQIERILQLGPQELRQVSNAARVEVGKIEEAIVNLEHATAQAAADLRVCTDLPWWY